MKQRFDPTDYLTEEEIARRKPMLDKLRKQMYRRITKTITYDDLYHIYSCSRCGWTWQPIPMQTEHCVLCPHCDH
jgi:rubrerythrin